MAKKPLREEGRLLESVVLKEGNEKSYYIQGIFLQAETENRNGRVYPIEVMKKAVNEYVRDFIQKNRAVGELGHPQSTTVNFDRVSHNVVSLEFRGNDVWGRAKVLTEMPCGKILKTLIDEGIQVGVSSRGMGTVKPIGGKDVVQNDLAFNAIDAVHDPSARAFVNGICESYGMIYKNGVVQPISKKMNKKEIKILEEFNKFIKSL